MLVDASTTVKFIAELLMSSLSIFSLQNNQINIAIVICKREVQMLRLLLVVRLYVHQLNPNQL